MTPETMNSELTDTETVAPETTRVSISQHVIEIISDLGEGSRKVARAFGMVSARMGNGIWTVEIVPDEIRPHPRSHSGAVGARVRVGSFPVTNGGDQADLVVAFNEMVLEGRMASGDLKPGATILLESMWREHPDAEIRKSYARFVQSARAEGYRLVEVPVERESRNVVGDEGGGKNMFVLGMLCCVYTRDLELARQEIDRQLGRSGKEVVDTNKALLEAGFAWAQANLDFQFEVPSAGVEGAQIAVNGNQALALGIMASGMDVCAMNPIAPASSVSHYLSEIFSTVGGIVHEAEDEIAACAFAIGASYAGKCAVTITSGPGLSLKTELIGLAVMAEIPLVVIDVQRGGPSTGLPTGVEQGDMLAALFSTHGDAPKVVMAPSTIQDSFYSVLTARKIAETFSIPVIILADANLATGQQPFPRPQFRKEWLAPPINQSPVPEDSKPYDWDPDTGLNQRFVPGQPGGMFTTTSLAHDRHGRVNYNPGVNQEAVRSRSLKIATLQKTLHRPKVHGDEEGDLLIVGWGSTKGAIEEAVSRARADGLRVSSLQMSFLQPMASGIGDILKRFGSIVAVEMNYSDDSANQAITPDNRRYSNLTWLLRARYLQDVDCWSNVRGRPIRPGEIEAMIRTRLKTV